MNMYKKNLFFILLTYVLFYTSPLIGQEIQNNVTKSAEKKTPQYKHYAGKWSLGVNSAIGYNLINYVNGTLDVIPNNYAPKPSPSTENNVYSNPISVTIDAPFLISEYWFAPDFSARVETGLSLMVVGATHEMANFAYLLTYVKVLGGGRYYFANTAAPFLFLGAGWFGNFPVAKPLIGFIEADTSANIDTGPYGEIGMNYPVSDLINLEFFARFYFGINRLTKIEDENILVDIVISPLELGFGISWNL